MNKIDVALPRQAPFRLDGDDLLNSKRAFVLARHPGDNLDLTSNPRVENTTPQMTNGGPCKIVLPRRSGESWLAPLQYYYPASRSGVLPS